MLMVSKSSTEGGDPGGSEAGNGEIGNSLDFSFEEATTGQSSTSLSDFLINDEWYIVDLPGYGYAKRSKDSREQLKKIIEDYVLEREQMTNLFVLIDCRLKPQKIDIEFMEWLGENGVPFSIVFTKLDKLGKVFTTSSEDGRGREEILNYIDEINQSLAQWDVKGTRSIEGTIIEFW